MTPIDAAGLSEAHGDRLRALRELFRQRADEARRRYHDASAAGASPVVLAHHRAKWMAWAAADVELRLAFDWTTVPSSIPPEAIQHLAQRQAERRRELTDLTARIRAKTRGVTGIDEELHQLRGDDHQEDES